MNAILSSSFPQVLSLLECMGLKKHHETFIDERVDGEILLECDDLLLQEELKVTSLGYCDYCLTFFHGNGLLFLCK